MSQAKGYAKTSHTRSVRSLPVVIVFLVAGSHPGSNCEAVRPTVAADTEAKGAFAAHSISSRPNTLARRMVMANWMGAMVVLLLQGIRAGPAATAPADVPAVRMMG